MKKIPSLLLAGTALALTAATSTAAVVLNFNMPTSPTSPGVAGTPIPTGTLTDYSVNYSPKTGQTSYTYSSAFSATTPIYTTIPSKGSVAIYGGYYSNASSGVAFDLPAANPIAARWNNNASGLQRWENLTPGTTLAENKINNAAYLLDISPSGGSFDSTSYLQFYGGGNQNGTSLRWLAYAGSTLYISDTLIGPTNLGTVVRTLDNPDAINWAVWTPGTTFDFSSGLTYNVLGSTITGISKVGVALNYSQTTINSGNVNIVGMQADLVPEPSAAVLLGLAGLALVVRRRRA